MITPLHANNGTCVYVNANLHIDDLFSLHIINKI